MAWSKTVEMWTLLTILLNDIVKHFVSAALQLYIAKKGTLSVGTGPQSYVVEQLLLCSQCTFD